MPNKSLLITRIQVSMLYRMKSVVILRILRRGSVTELRVMDVHATPPVGAVLW
ncbi:MAG: hypothetical protein QG626_250 [Patescibacteria group bacterium]|nr:hypothetical protein [Patescibacteria group bacterium]MDQ5952123.1 hypothetical protein [Patescibacteria group bacterium]